MSEETPEDQATIRPGNGGVVPPANRQFGQPDGNPRYAGPRNAGATVAMWYNMLAEVSFDDLQAIIGDPEQPNAKVAAAQQWLLSRLGKLDSVKEVCDRTHGQSLKQVKTESTVTRVKRVITPAPSRN